MFGLLYRQRISTNAHMNSQLVFQFEIRFGFSSHFEYRIFKKVEIPRWIHMGIPRISLYFFYNLFSTLQCKSIMVHYNYERWFAHYKAKIHHFWNGTFPIATGIDTKLIVGTRNNPNLTEELVRCNPCLSERRPSKQNPTASHWQNYFSFLCNFSFTSIVSIFPLICSSPSQCM